MATPANRRSGHSRRAQYSAFAGYVVAAAGILVAAILLIVSAGKSPAFSAVRGAASDISSPAAETIGGSRTASVSLWETLAGYLTKGRDVARMRREIAHSRVLLAEAAATAEENKRLKSLLALGNEDPRPIVSARLIASTSTSTRRFATLSAGTNQGVALGMPVRSPLGLVGRVLETGRTTARILLVTDSESVVPVRRASDGVAAFAEGHGDGTLRIRLINLGINPLKRGDAFVTSGAGGLYRPGIAIAVVQRILPDGAIARPLSDPGSTEFVAVEPTWTPTTVASPLAPPPEPAR